jgi:hypothetical protein
VAPLLLPLQKQAAVCLHHAHARFGPFSLLLATLPLLLQLQHWSCLLLPLLLLLQPLLRH